MEKLQIELLKFTDYFNMLQEQLINLQKLYIYSNELRSFIMDFNSISSKINLFLRRINNLTVKVNSYNGNNNNATSLTRINKINYYIEQYKITLFYANQITLYDYISKDILNISVLKVNLINQFITLLNHLKLNYPTIADLKFHIKSGHVDIIPYKNISPLKLKRESIIDTLIKREYNNNNSDNTTTITNTATNTVSSNNNDNDIIDNLKTTANTLINDLEWDYSDLNLQSNIEYIVNSLKNFLKITIDNLNDINIKNEYIKILNYNLDEKFTNIIRNALSKNGAISINSQIADVDALQLRINTLSRQLYDLEEEKQTIINNYEIEKRQLIKTYKEKEETLIDELVNKNLELSKIEELRKKEYENYNNKIDKLENELLQYKDDQLLLEKKIKNDLRKVKINQHYSRFHPYK